MNPMPGEEYKGIVDYMFTGDDGHTVDGEISYTAEVVGSDGDIDAGGLGGFYGLKVIPDSLEAHFDELGSENALAKLDDDFANSMIQPGGDEHEEALKSAQEDADEMFANADIDIPQESINEELSGFSYNYKKPVADNFVDFIEFTNQEREKKARDSGMYELPSLQQITDPLQLQKPWDYFLDTWSEFTRNDPQEKYFELIKSNYISQDQEREPGKREQIVIPQEMQIKPEEQFIIDFLHNRGYAHSKSMMKQIVDFMSGDSKQGSVASLKLNFDEGTNMSEEINDLRKLAGLQEACGGCEEQEQSEDESVHFRKEKSSEHGSVSIEASADSMEEMKRLLSLIGHDLPKEMSPSADDDVDNGPDGEVMAEPVAITVTQPEQGDKPFDPYGNNKKALLNYLRDSYNSQ